MEIKLENLLDVSLSPYAPALDPFVCDLQGKILSQNILQHAIDEIKYRLANVGFNKLDMKLISPGPIGLCIPDGIEYHIDKYCGEAIYLLTFSANGNRIISPPYEPGTYTIMSWEKWIDKIIAGEMLPLMNFAPWAQAKFINGDLG
jgi:hypothetical protein